MRGRLAAVALAALLAGLAPAGVALAAPGRGIPTRLTVSARTATVSGKPVVIDVVLMDARDEPVAGALIRLVTPVTFMGFDREEILDEARTDGSGAAELAFAPTETGAVIVTARYDGDPAYRAAEDSLAFEVREPVVAFHPEPVGVGAPWAHAYLIVVPFAGVWVAYLVALSQARRVRRAGPHPQLRGPAAGLP